MDSALLQNLMAGAGSSSQFIGGLVVALLYVVIGLLAAIGSILIFRRIFQGRWEQCGDSRLLPKLRCLFRGLNSCLAN
jgi:biopolymer transport protein ExbB/TolQ